MAGERIVSMTRPKGVPNRRTQATLNAAQEKGFTEKADKLIARFLKVAEDTSLDLQTRLQALNSVPPYVKPKLSAVEQTTIEPPRDESEVYVPGSGVRRIVGIGA
jgi:pyruvate carboxylase